VWLAIRIAVLYGAPAVAVAAAAGYFFVLLRRVRRGTLAPARAAALYPLSLLLAPAALGLVWATAELSSWLSVPAGTFNWDWGEALALLRALLPIAAYVGIPIAILALAFWITLAAWKKSS
jgi:hypothetical protein